MVYFTFENHNPYSIGKDYAALTSGHAQLDITLTQVPLNRQITMYVSPDDSDDLDDMLILTR